MRRPTSWLVFGILGLVFGGLGVLGSLFGLLMAFGNLHLGNADLNPLTSDPNYIWFMRISSPSNLVAELVLIAGGIGLLRFRPWGRWLSLLHAWYTIIVGALGTAFVVHLALPLLAQHQDSAVKHAAVVGGVIGGAIGGVIGMALPVLTLIFLWRDPRRAQADGGGPRPDSDNPYQSPGAA